ncbi:MAG: sodium:proton exchanger [Planctomyces sp.]|nr:sodium:proton exchanger [Planctomyces sp.]
MAELVNPVLALFGGLLLVLSLTSGLIKNRWFISEPTVALAFGVLIGPQVAGFVNHSSTQEELITFLDHLARITLVIALLDVATDLPRDYLWRQRRALTIMIFLVMPLMWLTSSLLAGLILGLPLLVCLAIGAIVTPTDPVIAHSVVSGKIARKSIPTRTRELILAESGANDALAHPIVMLPVLLLIHPDQAWSDWFINILLWDVIGGAALGALAGALAGKLLTRVRKSEASDEASLLTVSVTLSLTILGALKLAGSDGLLAAFAAGLVYNQFVAKEFQESREHVHAALRRLFELPAFIVLGIVLPWEEWWSRGWPIWLFAIAVVLFRRLPAVLLFCRWIEPLKSRSESLLVGWFGPIGIAALLYATIVFKKTGMENAWIVGSMVIMVSTVIHGVSATPLTRIFGRNHSHSPASPAEEDASREPAENQNR